MINIQEIVNGYRTSFQKQRQMAVLTGKRMKDSFYWLYFQFLMITCLIDLEPWEQVIFSSILAMIFTMLVFTAYVFISSHLRLAFRFFLQLLVK